MYYKIRHTTRFRYSDLITESITEVRMQPRSSEAQRCIDFKLSVRPFATTSSYHDYLGNLIHHFDIPGAHRDLMIVAESEVQMLLRPPLPDALSVHDWSLIDALASQGEHWEMATASERTETTALLDRLAEELNVVRRDDPLSLLCELNTSIYHSFSYDAYSTRVDSPIDQALRKRRGVCQDYTHIMLALLRNYLRIPCRYVSGYLYHRRADRSAAGATHAWLEALLPHVGWVGFDPTNNVLAGERHIQVGVGRDYHDVPPTRGVFKGNAGSELSVSVHVRQAEEADDGHDDGESNPPYQVTQQELQEQYTQALAALMQIQQQQ